MPRKPLHTAGGCGRWPVSPLPIRNPDTIKPRVPHVRGPQQARGCYETRGCPEQVEFGGTILAAKRHKNAAQGASPGDESGKNASPKGAKEEFCSSHAGFRRDGVEARFWRESAFQNYALTRFRCSNLGSARIAFPAFFCANRSSYRL